MHRGFLLLVLTLVAGGFGTASAGAPQHSITQQAIGGVKLGLTRSLYVRALGRPSFTTRFGQGVTRLVYADRALAIYLSSKGRGIAVMTSAAEYRTITGVGPCSTVEDLKRSYGKRLIANARAGHLVAYRLDRLLFAAPATRIGAVMLADGTLPASVAVNAGQCGGGEED